jgi:predicted RecA/RadA family phage recombinase
MKNYVQPGNMVTIVAPAGGVVSSQLVVLRAITGVAATTQAAGAEVEVATEGVFDLAKNAPDTFAVGDVAKVSAGSNIIATAGTLGVGWVVQAALAGSTTVRVKLTPSVASPPTLLASEQETHAAPPHRKSA